jgi:hypothetical protein
VAGRPSEPARAVACARWGGRLPAGGIGSLGTFDLADDLVRNLRRRHSRASGAPPP